MFRPKILSEQGYARLPGKDSDDSADETELFIRKTTFQEIPTVEKVVEEGDTLQALSIRYHCPVQYSDLLSSKTILLINLLDCRNQKVK